MDETRSSSLQKPIDWLHRFPNRITVYCPAAITDTPKKETHGGEECVNTATPNMEKGIAPSASPRCPGSNRCVVLPINKGMEEAEKAKINLVVLQGSAERWSLGCVNTRPVARGSREAGFTQPMVAMVHFLADPCTSRCQTSRTHSPWFLLLHATHCARERGMRRLLCSIHNK